MRILVTGATGNLGIPVSDALVKSNVGQILKGSRAFDSGDEFITLDYYSVDDLYKTFDGVDVIINLGMPDYRTAELHGDATIVATSKQIVNLALAAKKAKVKNIVHVSTAHVYGQLVGRISEESVTNPCTIYAKNHCAVEKILSEYQNDYMLTILRLSNVVGDFCMNGRPLFAQDLISNLMKNGCAKIHSNINTERNFVALHAFKNALLQILGSCSDERFRGVFNIGGIKTWRLIEFANLIASRIKSLKNIPVELIFQDVEPLVSLPFSYSIDKLTSLGVDLSADIESEIDSIILGCA